MSVPHHCRISGSTIAKELLLLLGRNAGPIHMIGVNDARRDTTRVYIPGRPGFEYHNDDAMLSLDDFSDKHMRPLAAKLAAGETSTEQAPRVSDWEVWERWV